MKGSEAAIGEILVKTTDSGFITALEDARIDGVTVSIRLEAGAVIGPPELWVSIKFAEHILGKAAQGAAIIFLRDAIVDRLKRRRSKTTINDVAVGADREEVESAIRGRKPPKRRAKQSSKKLPPPKAPSSNKRPRARK